ncbi:ribokinase [Oceanotoga sp. DSM 15011]|jgi:ribokinase|uniref:Ribokinase n=1 Tax=Oceanotoga teriensis TaxID=515440 RepID=A0AA45C761_9BACT|nr:MULTISPECIES: ribokinase [Oceanotoga]MDO7975894.1 ribokinase [Oceanotoga teriensis]PWJ95129.1 ribokinase [Oceanotoga teriensis]UYO99121.1 ribokinase [Oceanotoga sp. DSM 15011]
MIGVIGSTNIDIVLSVHHFTAPGETQKSDIIDTNFGGKGANQAITAAKLTKNPVYFCTVIGDDEYGKKIEKEFKKNNIEGYCIEKDTNTGRAYIEVSQEGENRIIIHPGANDKISTQKVDNFLEKYSDKIKYCMIQNEMPETTINYAIKKLKEKNIKIIYDPAPKEATNIENLKDIDFLTPNETEFEYLFRKVSNKIDLDLREKGLLFKKLTGVKNLIMKMGSKGSLLIDEKNQLSTIKSIKVKAVDSTAAGDIYNGSFVSALSDKNSIEKSLIFAAVSAGISVTKKGAQTSIPTREEIISKINS